MSISNLISELSYYVPRPVSSFTSFAYSCAAASLLRMYRASYGLICKESYQVVDIDNETLRGGLQHPLSPEQSKPAIVKDMRRGSTVVLKTGTSEKTFKQTKIFWFTVNTAKQAVEDLHSSLNDIQDEKMHSLMLDHSHQGISAAYIGRLIQSKIEDWQGDWTQNALSEISMEEAFSIPEEKRIYAANDSAYQITHIISETHGNPQVVTVQKIVLRIYTVGEAFDIFGRSLGNRSRILTRVKAKYVLNLTTGKAQLYYKPAQSFYLTKLIPKMIRRPINSLLFGPKQALAN